MAFDEEQLAQISNVNGFGLYRYDTLDSLGTVNTSGYINNPDDHVGLVVGDFIDVIVWTTSIRFGTISIIERHAVTQVNAVTGDVDLLSVVSGFARAIFASGQWGYWSANTSNISGMGLFEGMLVQDASSLKVEDDEGLAFRQNSGAVAGQLASIEHNTSDMLLNYRMLLVIKFRLGTTANLRFFAGMKKSPLSVDTFANSAVGLQFSTNRGDTNWQFMRNNAGTQALTDSGLAPDTGIHFFVMTVNSATSILIQIMDSTFTEQASTTLTTGLPTGTDAMGVACGVSPPNATDISIDQFYATILSRNS